MGVLEHIAHGNKDSEEYRRLIEKYPELDHPALWYSFLPDTKSAMAIYSELERSINWGWGSGRRVHTSAEVREKLMVLAIIKLRLFGELGGFERVQANSSTLNQNVVQREERRQRRSLNPFHKG